MMKLGFLFVLLLLLATSFASTEPLKINNIKSTKKAVNQFFFHAAYKYLHKYDLKQTFIIPNPGDTDD